MRRIVKLARTVARSRATVLLLGESGTGKERVARAIHDLSDRADGPWVAVNCAAIPENLLESELFGHEKGAFTGADRSRRGRFEQARGGTILLDEISEMPLPLQAKLLRVLQEFEVDRVGGHRPIPIDVRIIATSNRNLRAMVARGQFREDLYYRIHVFPLRLPPLRERPEDIESLVHHFLGRYGHRVAGITPAAMERLLSHSWPGNVRELENTVERAVLLCEGGTVDVEDLLLDEGAPLSFEGYPSAHAATAVKAASVSSHGWHNGVVEAWPVGSVALPQVPKVSPAGVKRPSARQLDDAGVPASMGGAASSEAVNACSHEKYADQESPASLAEIERLVILRTLEENGWNRTHAAKALGISLRTLRNRLREYREAGIDVPASTYGATAR